jgi:antitoxin component of RelBE/YafQ-DinJ toxin-antitoxin module
MTSSAVVRAPIDETSEAKAVADGALPFEPLIPNAETIEAMKAARRGELVTVGEPSSLLVSLNDKNE